MEDMQTSIKDKVSTVFSFSFLFLVLGTSRMEVLFLDHTWWVFLNIQNDGK